MRSVQDTSMLANYGQKFQSPKNDTTFTIAHGSTMFVVDTMGTVIDPFDLPLEYDPEDFMKGNQSGIVAKVKDFLTVTTEMDSPGSVNW